MATAVPSGAAAGRDFFGLLGLVDLVELLEQRGETALCRIEQTPFILGGLVLRAFRRAPVLRRGRFGGARFFFRRLRRGGCWSLRPGDAGAPPPCGPRERPARPPLRRGRRPS